MNLVMFYESESEISPRILFKYIKLECWIK